MAGGGLQEERDRGSAMANWSLDGGPGNRRAHPLSDAAGQSVGIAALWEDGQNVGQRPGLWHHGAPVKTQTWSGTGGGRLSTGPQARRRMRPDDQPKYRCSFLFPIEAD